MSDLRHEALNRQAIIAAAMEGRTLEPVYPPTSPPLSRSSMTASDDSEDDDTAYTPVHTRPGTPTALSHGARRSGLGPGGRGSGSSRTGTPSGSRSSSPTRLARKRALEEQERKTSKDPLRRFDNTVSSRIFRELDVTSLARCLRVCRRWHRSATINWAWYLRFQERRSEGPLNTEPVWTRRESKENWATRYRSAFTLNGLQYQTAHEMDMERARSDGYRTPKEQREDKWASEAAGNEGYLNDAFPSGDKVAAREYYKSIGGRSKVKGKSGFGSSSGPRDRTAYGDDDMY